MLAQSIGIRGEITLIATDPVTGVERMRVHAPNLVVNTGLSYLVSFLTGRLGALGASEVTHLALGINGNISAASDTALGSETIRVPVSTSLVLAPATTLWRAVFLSTVSNFHIRELGCFVSPNADTESRDEGIMFARSLLNFDNSGDTPADVTLEWRIIFSAT